MRNFTHNIRRAVLGAAAATIASLSCASGAQTQFSGPGVYVIRSVNSRNVLDVDNSWWRGDVEGMPLIQWGRHDGLNQQFRVVAAGNYTYNIIALHSGQCLEIPDLPRSEGIVIEQRPCSGLANQQFQINYFPFIDDHNIIATSDGNRLFSVAAPGGGDAHNWGSRILLLPYEPNIVNMQFDFLWVGP